MSRKAKAITGGQDKASGKGTGQNWYEAIAKAMGEVASQQTK